MTTRDQAIAALGIAKDEHRIREVLKRLMSHYSSEAQRAKDVAQASDDPADICKAQIDVVFWNAAWNTAFEIASELGIALQEKGQRP